MTKQPKPNTTDWANLPTEQWNTRTFTAYLTHLTEEHFGVAYEPTGGGAKQQRWARELGMMKQAQEKYGNVVLRRFIEMCVAEYTAKPQYPYASFTFMYSYMSDRFPKAQSAIAAEARREQAEDEQAQEFKADDVRGWL